MSDYAKQSQIMQIWVIKNLKCSTQKVSILSELYCQASFLKYAFLNYRLQLTNHPLKGLDKLMYNESEGHTVFLKVIEHNRTYLHVQGIATSKASHNVPWPYRLHKVD